jgi:hypothetical protein
MVFRRRRAADSDPQDAVEESVAGELDATADSSGDPDESAAPANPSRAGGPWDSIDAPDDDVPRIDLGSLLVPTPDGVELRVDMQDQTVINATLVHGPNAMQLQAFAAPRSSGIWLEVRDEIAESIRESGGSADLADGPFGAELTARVPPPPPEQGGPPRGTPSQPMRFVGVDGPRWFLRGLLSGPAATDPGQARRLLDVFRDTVVVRGGEAMPPRDLLPLRLPKEAMAHHPDAQQADPAETEQARPTLEMLERGPEITETQ